MEIKIGDIIIGRLYKGGGINCPNCSEGHMIEWNIDIYGEPCNWEFKLICEYCESEFSIVKDELGRFIIF